MERVDELRLELTSQGLPASGRVGLELFDRTAFGATEFLEQVNYRRALEGEIARTIGTLSEVSNARVHIAMGKEALFGESRPAKASVVLKLRGQRTLAPSTITGISNLVAASVEGLRPEAVVILDSYGRPLARPAVEDSEQGPADSSNGSSVSSGS
jgi:flagellar M-ring protein FliF